MWMLAFSPKMKLRASFQELTHAEFRQRHKSFLFRFAAAGET
jgi:hypothetical protein